MDRITATPDALVRQACETTEIYLSHAARWVQAQELPRKDWPAYIGIYVHRIGICIFSD